LTRPWKHDRVVSSKIKKERAPYNQRGREPQSPRLNRRRFKPKTDDFAHLCKKYVKSSVFFTPHRPFQTLGGERPVFPTPTGEGKRRLPDEETRPCAVFLHTRGSHDPYQSSDRSLSPNLRMPATICCKKKFIPRDAMHGHASRKIEDNHKNFQFLISNFSARGGSGFAGQ